MNEIVWAGEGFGKKVAVTDWAALIVTTQIPVPLHPAPLQPLNTDPLAGVAVSVTDVPLANDALHVAPQLIPTGLLVTVPLPLPAFVTVRVYTYTCVKLALTACAALIVTTQVPVPLHPAPLHPLNVDPLADVAVKVTCVPPANEALHVAPQSMPAGLLVTVPLPVPVFVTVRAYTYNCVKVALTACASVIVTTHVPVPLHPAPLQPLNTEPADGLAVRVTIVPLT